MEKPIISVVIPSLNEEKYIEKTLKSIVNQTLPREKYEVILSDGKSKDNTVKIAKKYIDKLVIKKNKSIAHGRNLGASKSKGKYLVFVDADSIISARLLKQVINTFEKDESIVGAFTIYKFRSKSIVIRLLNSIFIQLEKLSNMLFPRGTITTGACIIVRRSAFQQIGGFNEKLRTNEDNDLTKRLRKIGKVIMINKTTYTSDRRLKSMGAFRFVLYYLIDSIGHILFPGYKGKYIQT